MANDNTKNANLSLFEPSSFEEGVTIGNQLKSGTAVIVNLHRLQRDDAQRMIDFLTGVVYSLDGTIEKVAHQVILCSPRNVPVSGSINMSAE
ncbi:MAG: cell division protein SepF [Solobacterium sp.]|nr:cell division protein SepF [Erysipelotrichaceae bacterium]MBQ9154680.1 cell division protein SepF [Solobacterium sp.]